MSVSSFPISYPTPKFIEASFEINRRQSAGVLASGRDIVVDRGQPQWTASLKTQPLFVDQIAAWQAFKAQLRGGSRFFTGWDPSREYPAAYMPAGWGTPSRAVPLVGPFDGACSLSAIGYSGLPGNSRDLISIGAPNALPIGFTLHSGDLIGLRQGADLLTGLGLTPGRWFSLNTTLADAVTTAPDGGVSAGSATRVAAGNMYLAQASTAAAAGATFRASVWLRLGSLTGGISLTVQDAPGVHPVGIVATPNSSVWSRWEFTASLPAGLSGAAVFEINPLNPGAAGDTLYVWRPTLTAVSAEKYSLHRVLDPTPIVADSLGNLTAWVEPEVPASFSAGDAAAMLYRPSAKFRLATFDLPIAAAGRNRPGQVSLTALSTLL